MQIQDEKSKRHKNTMRMLSLVTNIGLTTAGCVLIGIFLGRFLDRLLNTSPLFLIVLLLLGVAAAFKNIYDVSKSIK